MLGKSSGQMQFAKPPPLYVLPKDCPLKQFALDYYDFGLNNDSHWDTNAAGYDKRKKSNSLLLLRCVLSSPSTTEGAKAILREKHLPFTVKITNLGLNGEIKQLKMYRTATSVIYDWLRRSTSFAVKSDIEKPLPKAALQRFGRELQKLEKPYRSRAI